MIILLLLGIQIWFFIPVQHYINDANEEIRPAATYYPWSAGHFIMPGIILAVVVLAFMAAA
jgi:hypothetical protein